MNSQILYFQRTTPQMEQIFNSYMDEAVMLYNEELLVQVQREMGRPLTPVFVALYLNSKWNEMVRDN